MTLLRLAGSRNEISSNFDSGESAEIYRIKYDPQITTPYRSGAQMQADGSAETGQPLKIYSYDFTVATTTLTQMFQTYCDDDDYALCSNWDLASNEFQMGLKQNKLVAGSKGRYVTKWDEELIGEDYEEGATNDNLLWKVGTIRFRARWNKRKKEWTIPPITLSASNKNTVSWNVANVGATDSAHYYAYLRIRKWKVVT